MVRNEKERRNEVQTKEHLKWKEKHKKRKQYKKIKNGENWKSQRIKHYLGNFFMSCLFANKIICSSIEYDLQKLKCNVLLEVLVDETYFPLLSHRRGEASLTLIYRYFHGK